MKKALSFFLSLILVIGLLPLSAAPVKAEEENGWSYSVTNGEATITGYSDPVGDLTISSSLGGYPVTGIGIIAFEECHHLTHVTIPAGVTSIDGEAFSGCSRLASVTIPASVASIGGGAFWGCSSLTSITIPAGVTSIEDSTFYYCSSLSSVTIPESVTSISECVFQGCSSLSDIWYSGVETQWNAVEIGRYNEPLFNAQIHYSATAPIDDDGGAGNGPAHEVEDGWTYDVSNGQAMIIDCSEPFGDLTIPDTLGGYPVTGIDKYAFYNYRDISSVTIPESVTSIGNEAFACCSSLTSVTIPDSVTSIGDGAFYNCRNLTRVDISDLTAWCGISFGNAYGNPLSSAKHLFLNGTEVTDLTIPDNATSIGAFSFNGCIGLTSVMIPAGVTSIGSEAFSGCSGLTGALTIPEGVTSIGAFAFNGCIGLTSVTIPAGVTSIGSGAFSGCSGLTGTLTIPEGVTSIGSRAFSGCSGLTGALTISEGVTSIGNEAFLYCSGLTSVTIPESVTSIGDEAFACCSSLTSVTIPDGVTSIGFGVFSGCGLIDMTIPAGVTEITYDFFFGCSSLTSVTIPSSVTSIGNSAFYNCSGLTDVWYGGSGAQWNAVTIEEENDPLLNAEIHYSVTVTFDANGGAGSMDAQKVYENISTVLTANSFTRDGFHFTGWNTAADGSGTAYADGASVTIDADLTLYAQWEADGPAIIASGNCGENGNNLIWTLTDDGTLTISGSGATPDWIPSDDAPWHPYCDSIRSVVIAEGVTSIGKQSFYNFSSMTDITFPSSVTNIGDYAFSGCSSLAEITLPEGLESISAGLFTRCEALTNVQIPSGATSIGYCAFGGCKGLTSVSIPDSVVSIEGYAFNGCCSLTDVALPEGITSIGNCAFSGCKNLTSVTIPEGVTSIGSDAFNSCSSLTSVMIPDSVTSIAESAFSSCESLTSVTIPEGVTSIGEGAFGFCTGLTNVTLPDSVTSISDYAFQSCRSLTNVTIPAGVTSIGSSAFEGCSGLTGALTIPAGVTSIGGSAFSGCSGLTSVTIPESVTSIGAVAFYNCSSLTDVWYGGSAAQWSAVTIGNANDPLLDAEIHYSVTVTFDANGGAGSMDAQKVYENTAAPLAANAFTYTKYHFTGWNTAADGSGDAYADGASVTLTGDLTLYAQWEKDPPAIIAWGVCGTNASWTLDENGLLAVTGSGDMKDYYLASESVFYNVRSRIKTVDIADGVTSIGAYAFSGCAAMTDVTIPASVTKIGENAFEDCENLERVDITDLAVWCGVSFGSEYANPIASAHAFRLNGEEVTALTVPAGVSRINSYAFYGCSALTDAVIPEGVTVIGLSAFSGCSGLTGVTIPEGVVLLGGAAFSDCSSLTEVTIPSSVTSIGGDAFSDCVSLESATLLPGVKNIGDYAFYKCRNLTSVTMPDSVTLIGEQAFFGCSALTDVTIPEGVKTIGSSAFSRCTGLTDVTIPSSVRTLGDWAFQGCSGLTDVTILDGVTLIDEYTFYGCDSLAGVAIPASVKTIADEAFDGCDALTDVFFAGTAAQWSAVSIGDDNDPLTGATVHYGAFTMTFDANGGEGTMEAQILPANTATALEANTFTRVGHTFTGWNTAADGSGTACADAQSVTPDADQTLYAQWQINTYTITWIVDGTSETETLEYGAVPSRADPEKAEDAVYTYSFTGWMPEPAAVTEDVTYTAGFASVLRQYSVTFDANGGEGSMEAQIVSANTAAALEGNAFKWAGHIFTGWNTDADGSGTAYADGAEVTILGDFTLYARWKDVDPVAAIPVVSAASVPGKNTVTWSVVEDATRYRMYRRAYNGAAWDAWVLLDTNLKGTSWTDTDVTAGTTYMYRMRALVGSTWYGYSNSAEVTAKGPADAVPAVSAVSVPGKNTVTWSAIDGAARYRMYRRVNSGSAWGDWVLVDTNVKGTTWTDTEVTAGADYLYRMRALVDGTWYGYSNTAAVTAKTPADMAPTVKGVAETGKITVTWDAVEGAVRYRMYRRVYNGSAWGEWVLLNTKLKGTSWTDTNVTAGMTCMYRMRALVDGTWYGYSNSVTVKAVTPAVTATTVKAAAAAGKNTLTWEALEGATRYRVYRRAYNGSAWGAWELLDANVKGASWTDTDVTPGTKYMYRMRALIGSTWYGYSNNATATAK